MAADVSLSVDPLDSAVSKDSEPEATKEILSPSSDSPHPQSPPTVVADTLDVAPSLDPAQSPKGEMVTGSNVEMEPDRRRRGLSPASMRELIKPKPGSYYCVAKQAISNPAVRASEDLMSRLGLNRIAHSVARQNLTTGALSGLRQSYKNQATALDFPGLHNPVSRPEGNRPSLTDMWHMPVDYWENMYVRGADIKDGMASELVSNLENAFTMENNPNALAGHDIRWLDLDAAEGGKTKRGSTAKPSLKRPALNVMATAPSGASLRVSTPGSSRSADTAAMLGDLNRPKRSGKKRRYNDDSFEGYGEGFIDDDGVSVSSLGADERRKKRRKTEDSLRSPGVERRDNLLLPGMGLTGKAHG